MKKVVLARLREITATALDGVQTETYWARRVGLALLGVAGFVLLLTLDFWEWMKTAPLIGRVASEVHITPWLGAVVWLLGLLWVTYQTYDAVVPEGQRLGLGSRPRPS